MNFFLLKCRIKMPNKRTWLARFALLVLAASPASHAQSDAITQQTQANVMTEIVFTAAAAHEDPFNSVNVDAVFTTPDGTQLKVPAFWAGGNKWKVRYASPRVGAHRFETNCSNTDDKGLHAIQGSVEILPYTGSNPLYKHGPIQIAQNKRYFEHTDGKPFFWLGDTWWMGLCHRLHWPDEIKTLAADRKQKGFNVIQIVAGLYPDMHPFDPRGANEAGHPWEAEYAAIRPEYFDAADKRLLYLVDEGFTPCIVGAWGYFMPWMGVDKMQQHWRYLIARYGPLPVVWCAAGEANLPWYLAKGFPYDDREQVKQWTHVLRYIRETDPFHHPLTIHPTGIGRLSARHATDDPMLLDFDLLQTPHAQREAVEPTVRTVQESYADTSRMPVINGEAAYEMLGDTLPTKWTRQMFWLCMTNGAAGHTYGANGIWQCNRPEKPHGPSPHHPPDSPGYGRIPWTESMNLPGSSQVAYGKKLFEKYAWQEFEPLQDAAEYANDPEPWRPHWRHWIWHPEGNPAADAPAPKRYFRKEFTTYEERPVATATLWITADDRFVAYLNGERVGDGIDWRTPQKFDVTRLIRAGDNVLAIEAENAPAPAANPAGLLASLLIQNHAGEEYDIHTDATWRTAEKPNDESLHWTQLEHDDANWSAAQSVADYPSLPWGEFARPSSYGPYATGIPGKLRIIYVPEPRSIRVKNLEHGSKYLATAFDPQKGESVELGKFAPEPNASKIFWKGHTFIDGDKKVQINAADDWVLVLEKLE
jgi:hypothetical protein